MQKTAQRLTELRKSVHFTQVKISQVLGISQSAINRYEHDQATISDEVLLAYADYFDVSLDYICGRTDKPEGKLFTARPNITEDNEELRQFIDMCFDPKSTVSVKLKDTLYQIMTGGNENE
jgi:transcriptional regulator with XRE-family HTH domain